MAWRKMKDYRLCWKYNNTGGKGEVTLSSEEGDPFTIEDMPYGDYNVIVGMLQNEEHVWFEDKRRIFRTGEEEPEEVKPKEEKKVHMTYAKPSIGGQILREG